MPFLYNFQIYLLYSDLNTGFREVGGNTQDKVKLASRDFFQTLKTSLRTRGNKEWGKNYINETSYTLVKGPQLLFSWDFERLSQTAVAGS